MDSNTNIVIENPTSSACRVWYTVTAGDDGLTLRFVAPWSQIYIAHTADPEVGAHPFARITSLYSGDDEPAPSGPRTHDRSVLESHDGLDARLNAQAVLDEWTLFCDETVDGAADHMGCDENELDAAQVREFMPLTWGAKDAEQVEVILRQDRSEQLAEVTDKLDSGGLGKLLATAKSLMSTQMLAAS